MQLETVVSPPMTRLTAAEVLGTAVHTRAVVGGLSSVYQRLLKECSALERSVDSLQRQRDRSAVAAVASSSSSPFVSNHDEVVGRSATVVSELHAAQTVHRQERMALLAQARAQTPPPSPPPLSPPPPVARRGCCSRGLSDHVCQLTRLTPLKSSRPSGQLSLSAPPPPPPLLEVR